jgi:DNA helicase II / ATP-dependent DNA helicase PcrA
MPKRPAKPTSQPAPIADATPAASARPDLFTSSPDAPRDSLLAGLRDAQRRAVTFDGKALIVLAGPGTGKTRVIVHRVAHLIRERRVAPERVLACTFSVRAARELRERLAGPSSDGAPPLLAPQEARKVRAQTMHALGAWIVRRFADRLGLPSRTMMADPAQRRRLIKQIVTRDGLFPHAYAEGIDALAARVERAIDTLGERGILPERALAFAEAQRAAGATAFRGAPEDDDNVLNARLTEFEHTARAFAASAKLMRERGWLTFSDLMLLPIELLSKDAQAAALVRSEFAHILVDEFQDNNQGQIELLALLSGVKAVGGGAAGGSQGPSVCVVGDDDQAIYGFRGSDEQAFRRFSRYWPDAEVVQLTENFRSTPTIVRAANSVIERANSRFRPDKQSVSMRADDNRPVELVMLSDEKKDGETIASMLRSAQAEVASKPAPWNWSDCAVLVRTHGDGDRIASVLGLEGIPWERSRQRTELDDAGVDDVLAWAKWLIDEDDTAAARRCIARPPIIVDPGLITTWERRYRELCNKHAVDPDGVAHPGRYPSFLGALLPTSMDDAQYAALRRCLDLHAALRERTATMRADEAIDLLVQQLDVAHAELLGGIDRAKRVRALVTLLRLAREKQPLLDQPGDLRAFLRYLGELRDADPKLESVARSAADSIDSDADDDDARDASGENDPAKEANKPTGRVQILTGHAAKGLEFHTVFVTRVHPPHGFPKTKDNPREDRWTLPPGLIEGPDALDNQSAMLDEERRLFYVACTRAKSRLVLLAKHSGKPSRAAMHFFDELVTTPPADVPLTRFHGDDAIITASRSGLVSQAIAIESQPSDATGPAKAAPRVEDVSREFPHRQDIAEVVAGVHRQARLAAAGALERAMSPAERDVASPEAFERSMDAIKRLARHAGAVALASKGKPVPAWMLAGDAELEKIVRRVQAGAPRGMDDEGGGFVLVPPPLPLRLSFTSVSDYQRCPRCWYAKHVLRLPEPESKETVVGQAAHAALERFYKAWTAADAEGQARPGKAELMRMGREQLVQLAGPRAEGLADQLAQVHAQLESYHATMHDPNVHILENEWDVNFPLTMGKHTHEVIAKVDRLDQMPDGSFRVVDYKTGKPWKKLTSPAKDDLQLGMYCLAVRAAQQVADGESLDGTLEYWCLMSGERGVLRFADVKREKIIEQLREAAEGIAAGHFDRADKDCWGLCSIL